MIFLFCSLIISIELPTPNICFNDNNMFECPESSKNFDVLGEFLDYIYHNSNSSENSLLVLPSNSNKIEINVSGIPLGELFISGLGTHIKIVQDGTGGPQSINFFNCFIDVFQLDNDTKHFTNYYSSNSSLNMILSSSVAYSGAYFDIVNSSISLLNNNNSQGKISVYQISLQNSSLNVTHELYSRILYVSNNSLLYSISTPLELYDLYITSADNEDMFQNFDSEITLARIHVENSIIHLPFIKYIGAITIQSTFLFNKSNTIHPLSLLSCNNFSATKINLVYCFDQDALPNNENFNDFIGKSFVLFQNNNPGSASFSNMYFTENYQFNPYIFGPNTNFYNFLITNSEITIKFINMPDDYSIQVCIYSDEPSICESSKIAIPMNNLDTFTSQITNRTSIIDFAIASNFDNSDFLYLNFPNHIRNSLIIFFGIHSSFEVENPKLNIEFNPSQLGVIRDIKFNTSFQLDFKSSQDSNLICPFSSISIIENTSFLENIETKVDFKFTYIKINIETYIERKWTPSIKTGIISLTFKDNNDSHFGFCNQIIFHNGYITIISTKSKELNLTNDEIENFTLINEQNLRDQKELILGELHLSCDEQSPDYPLIKFGTSETICGLSIYNTDNSKTITRSYANEFRSDFYIVFESTIDFDKPILSFIGSPIGMKNLSIYSSSYLTSQSFLPFKLPSYVDDILFIIGTNIFAMNQSSIEYSLPSQTVRGLSVLGFDSLKSNLHLQKLEIRTDTDIVGYFNGDVNSIINGKEVDIKTDEISVENDDILKRDLYISSFSISKTFTIKESKIRTKSSILQGQKCFLDNLIIELHENDDFSASYEMIQKGNSDVKLVSVIIDQLKNIESLSRSNNIIRNIDNIQIQLSTVKITIDGNEYELFVNQNNEIEVLTNNTTSSPSEKSKQPFTKSQGFIVLMVFVGIISLGAIVLLTILIKKQNQRKASRDEDTLNVEMI